jgi:predicted DNA-binding transcriptional regulator AlpA
MNKFLVGLVVAVGVAIAALLGGISTLAASDLAHHVGLIAGNIALHTSFLASNVPEWHAAAIAAIGNVKVYLTSKEVALRYGIDVRSIYRRVKLGILPPPVYLGTRFPRWSIQSLDQSDRKYASVRVEHGGTLAMAKINAAKKKAAKKKPARKQAAAVEQNEVNF